MPQSSEEPANNNLSSEEVVNTGPGQSQIRCASDIVRQFSQEDMDAESSQPQTSQEPNRDRPNSQEGIDAESSQPHTRVDDSPLSKLFGSDGSELNESCQAFFTRKMQELGTEAVEEEIPESHEPLPKESETEPLTIVPTQEKVKPPERLQQRTPDVTFLDVPKICPTSSSSSALSSPLKRAKLVRPTVTSSPTLHIYSHRESSINLSTALNDNSNNGGVYEQPNQMCTSSDFEIGTDAESSNACGSTMADALTAGRYNPIVEVEETSSLSTEPPPRNMGKPETLKVSSRSMLKEYFAKADPVELLRGHATIALTEDQISSVLRVVADETARASYDMLENLVYRASRLSLVAPIPGKRVSKPSSVRKLSRGSLGAGSESEASSETSGAIRSDDGFTSIGYSYEHSELEGVAPPPGGPPDTECGPSVRTSHQAGTTVCSPGSQTLAALRQEALTDQSAAKRKPGSRPKPSSSGRTRRPITRSCKIMKEAYFKGMEWTKTFVSGPVDPRWNPYKFYCQICKANISIYGKGAREILRHHSTEKHLRKDQRWRFEHLSKVDPITRRTIHQVRGKDGKLLSLYQLELGYPKFKGAPLVDIGKKLPFYEEYMAGTDYMASSSDNRARIQISVLCRFLIHYCDIYVLKGFWSDVGVIVNHQALFTDFNWGKERLSVI